MKRSMLAVLVIISAFSCKKETTQYSATGMWFGNIYLANCAMLNRPNGTSRHFEEVGLYDTAVATIKVEGTYKVTGNRYRAEYYQGNILAMVVEGEFTAPDRIVGRMIRGSYNFDMTMNKKP